MAESPALCPKAGVRAEEVKAWLRQIGQDRYWLAERLATPKPTIDGWLTRDKIPPWAAAFLRLLMGQGLETSLFTVEEIASLSRAAQEDGFDDLREYFRHLVRQRIEQPPALRVAEPAPKTTYRGKRNPR